MSDTVSLDIGHPPALLHPAIIHSMCLWRSGTVQSVGQLCLGAEWFI